MKKGWTTTKLIAICALAVMDFSLWLVLGSAIFWATGSIFGAVISLFLQPFFAVFVALVIKQFGAVTSFEVLRFLVGLPLPSIIPKPINLVMGIFLGFVMDTLSSLLLGKSKKLFSFVGGSIYNFIFSLEIIVLYFSIGLPGTQNVPYFLVRPAGLAACALIIMVIGGLSGHAGFLVYGRLSNTDVIKRIQAK